MRKAFLPLLALVLSACSTTEDTAVPPNELTDFEPGAEVREAWSADTGWGGTGKWVRLAPFADGGGVYAANHGGDVSAWALDGGDLDWSVDLDTQLTAGVGGDALGDSVDDLPEFEVGCAVPRGEDGLDLGGERLGGLGTLVFQVLGFLLQLLSHLWITLLLIIFDGFINKSCLEWNYHETLS